LCLSKAWQFDFWFKLQFKKCKRCIYNFVNDVYITYRSADTVELTKMLNAIPVGRVAEIEKIIKEELDK